MIKKVLTYGLILFTMLQLSSCFIQKEYVEPQVEEVENYRNTVALDSISFADTVWWEIFNDQTLVSLIDEGLNNNLSLENLVSVIKQAQLQVEIAESQLYPNINYGVSGNFLQNTLSNASTESISAAANVSYTIDVWGRINNQNEAALQAYLATDMAANELRATLVSQIATTYFTLRDVDNKILIAEAMITSLKEFRDVIKARYDGGFISKVDLNQVTISQKNAEVTLQALLRSRRQIENGLSTLLGSTPKDIERGLPLQEQIFPSDLPLDVPVGLLQRRPSILIAERELKAQLAILGATEALRYPNFTLSLDLGTQILKPSSLFANFLGNMVGPIFNRGRIENTITIEEEGLKQAYIAYEREYLLAFQEVEDALIAIETFEIEFEIRKQQLDLAQEALDLSWVRYNEGVTSFLEFINLQTSLFNAQLNASESYKSQLESIVKLYLALGGGWQNNN